MLWQWNSYQGIYSQTTDHKLAYRQIKTLIALENIFIIQNYTLTNISIIYFSLYFKPIDIKSHSLGFSKPSTFCS